MSRSTAPFSAVENRFDRERECEESREKRERTRALLEETARSMVAAAFGNRSKEEQEALAWLVIDQVVDRLRALISIESIMSGLSAVIGRLTKLIPINPKASSAKTAAERERLFRQPEGVA